MTNWRILNIFNKCVIKLGRQRDACLCGNSLFITCFWNKIAKIFRLHRKIVFTRIDIPYPKFNYFRNYQK
jgi:hypothetical protein